MTAKILVASLLKIAHEDLQGARLLATQNNRNGIYLGEQAAEKIIRAVLTSDAKHAGIGHRLDSMVDLLDDTHPLKATLRTIEHLAAFATSYRYPTPAGRIVLAPGRAAFDAEASKVETALDATARMLGVAL